MNDDTWTYTATADGVVTSETCDTPYAAIRRARAFCANAKTARIVIESRYGRSVENGRREFGELVWFTEETVVEEKGIRRALLREVE